MGEFFGVFTKYFKELPAVIAERTRRRLWLLATRTYRNGVLGFFVASLLLVLSAGLVRVAIAAFRSHHKAIEAEMTRLLGSEQQPKRNERYFGLIAAVLQAPHTSISVVRREDGTIGAKELQVCSESPRGECVQAQAFHKLVQSIAKGALDAGKEPGKLAEFVLGGAMRDFGLKADPSRDSVWLRRAADDIAAYRRGAEPCDLADGHHDGVSDGYWDDYGDWGRDTSDGVLDRPSLALIPSVANADIRQFKSGFCRPDAGITSLGAMPDMAFGLPYMARIAEAVLVARLFDDVVELLKLALADKKMNTGEPKVVHAFFLSVENVLRIWRRDAYDPNAPSERQLFNPMEQFSANEYFAKFVEKVGWKRDLVDTRPYVDMDGYGIIGTYCMPLVARDAKLLGVSCIDYTIPGVPAIQRGQAAGQYAHVVDLCDSRLLTVYHVALTLHYDNAPSLEISERQIEVRNPCPGSDAVRESEKELVRKSLRKSSVEELLRAVVQVQQDGGDSDRRWTIPLGRSGMQLALLLVKAKSPSVGQLAYVLVGAGTVVFILAVVVLALSISQAKAYENESRQLELLRGLHVGFIETDLEGRIVRANDRAEELLGLRLPRSRSFEGDGEPVAFREIIDGEDLRDDSGGRTTYDHVLGLRRDGKASSYYAFVRSGRLLGRWIRVSGTPVFDSAGGKVRGAFGVLEVTVHGAIGNSEGGGVP